MTCDVEVVGDEERAVAKARLDDLEDRQIERLPAVEKQEVDVEVEPAEGLARVALADLDDVGQAGAGDVGARGFDFGGLYFRRDDATADVARAWLDEASRIVAEAPAAARERTFAVRASDAIVGLIAAEVSSRLQARSSGLRVRFVPEGDEDPEPLRDGRVDLDIGVASDDDAPELRAELLLKERFLGLTREGHPLTKGRLTAKRYARCQHISVSRRGLAHGPIDRALASEGLARNVVLVVPSFYAAVMAAASSDLVASLPGRLAQHLARAMPVATFELPVATPAGRVRQAWHPRHDADDAHRWLRDAVRGSFGR